MNDFHHHILSVLVQNRPGVLARVAGLFARRGFNIFSLAVAPAENDGMSRITIVVDVESTPLEQITKQLFKLVEVVKISELDPRRSVERELLLATVRATPEHRGQVVELVTIFEAKILAVGAEALTVSLEGDPTSSTTSRSCWRRMASWSSSAPDGSRSPNSTARRACAP